MLAGARTQRADRVPCVPPTRNCEQCLRITARIVKKLRGRSCVATRPAFSEGSGVPRRPACARPSAWRGGAVRFSEPHDHLWRMIVRGKPALYQNCVRMEATLKPFHSQNASFYPILIDIPDTFFGGWMDGLSGWLLFMSFLMRYWSRL